MFTTLVGRPHDPGIHYVYLLDWAQSVGRPARRLKVTEFHLMENWKKAGYFSQSIESRDAFLKEHPRFLVLRRPPLKVQAEEPIIGNLLVQRFQATPGYRVSQYDVAPKDSYEVWLICKGSCSSNGVTASDT